MRKVILGILIAALGTTAVAQTTMTQVWRVNASERDWLTTFTVITPEGTTSSINGARSADYNPVTDHITVVSRDTTATLMIVDPATGADITSVSLLAATGGFFTVNKHAIADDGAIYICNMTRNWSIDAFTIYRMANESAPLTVAYSTTSTALGVTTDTARIGDAFDVVGSGANTELWAGTRVAGGPHLIKFKSADGLTFSIDQMTTISGTFTSSPTYRGLSVKGTGPGASIWVKEALIGAMKVNAATGAVEATIASSTQVPEIMNLVPVGQLPFGIVAFGPGAFNYLNPAQEKGYLAKPSGVTYATIANTLPLAEPYSPAPANGNASGSVTYDPVRENVIFLVTNNSLSAHNVPASANAAQDWQLFE